MTRSFAAAAGVDPARRATAPVMANGDRELDDVPAIAISLLLQCQSVRTRGVGTAALHASLDEQLDVRAALLVSIEAMLERMVEAVDREVIGTSGIGPVQERTMIGSLGHAKVSDVVVCARARRVATRHTMRRLLLRLSSLSATPRCGREYVGRPRQARIAGCFWVLTLLEVPE
jgi:hypothetical protein